MTELTKTELIKENQRFPEYTAIREHLFNFLDEQTLSIYLEIYEMSIQDEFEKNSFYGYDFPVLDAITNIGMSNEESLHQVEEALSDFIQRYDLRHLNYQIQNLEQQYYLKQSQAMTIDEVIDTLDLVLQNG